MIKRRYGDCDYWFDEKATGEAYIEQLNLALALGDYAMWHLLSYGVWPPKKMARWRYESLRWQAKKKCITQR